MGGSDGDEAEVHPVPPPSVPVFDPLGLGKQKQPDDLTEFTVATVEASGANPLALAFAEVVGALRRAWRNRSRRKDIPDRRYE